MRSRQTKCPNPDYGVYKGPPPSLSVLWSGKSTLGMSGYSGGSRLTNKLLFVLHTHLPDDSD